MPIFRVRDKSEDGRGDEPIPALFHEFVREDVVVGFELLIFGQEARFDVELIGALEGFRVEHRRERRCSHRHLGGFFEYVGIGDVQPLGEDLLGLVGVLVDKAAAFTTACPIF